MHMWRSTFRSHFLCLARFQPLDSGCQAHTTCAFTHGAISLGPSPSSCGSRAVTVSVECPMGVNLGIDESLPLWNYMPPFLSPEEGKIYSLVVDETQLDQPRSYTVQLALRKVSRCLPHLRVACMASNQSSTLYITGKKHSHGEGDGSMGTSAGHPRLRIRSSPQSPHRGGPSSMSAVPKAEKAIPCKLGQPVWHQNSKRPYLKQDGRHRPTPEVAL